MGIIGKFNWLYQAVEFLNMEVTTNGLWLPLRLGLTLVMLLSLPYLIGLLRWTVASLKI